MTRTLGCFLALGVLAVAAMLASPAVAADKIAVLIIDGQNNHGWAKTTPPIKEMLEKTGKFTVDVLTSPPSPAKVDPKKQLTDEEKKALDEAEKARKALWPNFKPDFSKYQVVFSNYNGEAWPAEVNAAFEKYMAGGGGLVVFHAANNAFTKWEPWAKMCALLWQPAAGGERVTVDDSGKVVRTPKGEGIGAGHGPQWAYECIVRNKEHPITKGLPEKIMHVKDELYQGQRGPGENMTILLTAFAKTEMKGSGTNEPMVFTVACGKGRVFVNLLGHDEKSTVADPLCAILMLRGTEWAATGKVTIPVPANLAADAAAAASAK
jgi:trehalose utilization protein